MRINEVDSSSSDDSSAKVAALAEFLTGRASDTNSKKQIDVNTFIALANQQGASVTKQSLIDMSQDQLKEIFTVQGDKIVFSGGESDNLEMPVDKAEQIVANAAKSAAKKDRGV